MSNEIDKTHKTNNTANAKASGACIVRLFQKYDGNQNSKRYTPGHLFLPNSLTALCGFKFNKKSAQIIEKEYEDYIPFFSELNKICKRCHKIAYQA